MDVHRAIEERRAYRSLEAVDVTAELITELAQAARLAPSCMNNQPWHYVFVHGPEQLEKVKDTLSRGNRWATAASMIIAVLSQPELDCRSRGRDFFMFDTGMATAQLMLRATELGLVAHPILGFSETEAVDVLGIPQEMRVIALLIVGRKSSAISPLLSEGQVESELARPGRKPLNEFAYVDRFGQTAN